MRKFLASVCLTVVLSFSALAGEGIIYTEKTPPPPPPPVGGFASEDTGEDVVVEIVIDVLNTILIII